MLFGAVKMQRKPVILFSLMLIDMLSGFSFLCVLDAVKVQNTSVIHYALCWFTGILYAVEIHRSCHSAKISRAVKMHNTSVILVSKYWFTCFLYAVEMHCDLVIPIFLFLFL
jgi:hypothetical protein